jgi:hypothetical protein
MDVRVRLSRNTSMYLPFWVAIPVWVLAGAAWLVVLVLWALVMAVVCIVKGLAWLSVWTAGKLRNRGRWSR